MNSFKELEESYQVLLDTYTLRPEWKNRIKISVERILKNRIIYEDISKALGGNIPWEFIGCLHMLEGNLNLKTHLHNGDPLTHRTSHVPAGRPDRGIPPFTFRESAIDALTMKGYDNPEYSWTDAFVCWAGERYNGFGYHNRNRLSPYLWSGSNQYFKGKYVADGIYDPEAVSDQVGLVPMYLELNKLTKEVVVEKLKQTSRRFIFIERFKQFLASLGGVSYLTMTNISDVKSFVSDHTGTVIFAIAVILWLGFKYIDFLSTRELKEGRYTPSKADTQDDK